MKTWKEVEQRLKSEDGGGEIPAGLHDRILRAVRDDRAARPGTAPSRPYAGLWLAAGIATLAVIGIVVAALLPPPHAAQVGQAPETPAFSLTGLAALATAPMQKEYDNLQSDLAAAARFITAPLPGNGSGS